MPSYDLQGGNTDGTKTDCGNVVVSMSGGSPTIGYRPQGNTGTPTPIAGATYTSNPNGNGGTATSPKAGDQLFLNNYSVTIGTTTYNFPGTGTFQDRNGSNPKGYYHSASLTGQVGDWDCADDGSGVP
jgi:hypothetical protein